MTAELMTLPFWHPIVALVLKEEVTLIVEISTSLFVCAAEKFVTAGRMGGGKS